MLRKGMKEKPFTGVFVHGKIGVQQGKICIKVEYKEESGSYNSKEDSNKNCRRKRGK